jgi:hypothetical protein
LKPFEILLLGALRLAARGGCSACVRAHRMALMAQRQFWASLLRDSIAFKDMQRSLQQMQFAEQRAEAIYRR